MVLRHQLQVVGLARELAGGRYYGRAIEGRWCREVLRARGRGWQGGGLTVGVAHRRWSRTWRGGSPETLGVNVEGVTLVRGEGCSRGCRWRRSWTRLGWTLVGVRGGRRRRCREACTQGQRGVGGHCIGDKLACVAGMPMGMCCAADDGRTEEDADGLPWT